jgi:hypothetical protein
MPEQMTIQVVPAGELQRGDTIPVRFLGYGEIQCPVVGRARPRTLGPFAGRMVDVAVTIGADGPLHCTSVRSDETFTVLR